MSLNEYALYAQGYFKKLDRDQQPFRKLYQLIWNINPGTKGHKIWSAEMLSTHWPLYVNSAAIAKATNEAIQARWERALALTRKMKQGNGNHTEFRHNDN